jgi:hypothetical protein
VAEYDFTRTAWDGETCVVQFVSGSPTDERRSEVVLELHVVFAPPDSFADRQKLGGPHAHRVRIREPRVIGAALLAEDDRLGATELQRFAWRRWLDVAEDVARHGARGTDRTRKVRRNAIRRDAGEAPEPLRPGRRGHSREFYQQILDRYRELREDEGHSRPVTVIASEHGVALSTADGWVRRAKQLDEEETA